MSRHPTMYDMQQAIAAMQARQGPWLESASWRLLSQRCPFADRGLPNKHRKAARNARRARR